MKNSGRSIRALVGAAALAFTVPAGAAGADVERTPSPDHDSQAPERELALSLALNAPEAQTYAERAYAQTHCEPGEALESVVSTLGEDSLRALIEQRASSAEDHRRYEDLDELTTLWLTLAKRDQLDRVVERGEQYLNTALKNQRRSAFRSQSRALKRSGSPTHEPAAASVSVDEMLDAEQFVAELDEPYRTAVRHTLTGMNHREVAEEMGVSHAAVRKWAQRLRERLRDEPPATLS